MVNKSLIMMMYMDTKGILIKINNSYFEVEQVIPFYSNRKKALTNLRKFLKGIRDNSIKEYQKEHDKLIQIDKHFPQITDYEVLKALTAFNFSFKVIDDFVCLTNGYYTIRYSNDGKLLNIQYPDKSIIAKNELKLNANTSDIEYLLYRLDKSDDIHGK